MRLGAVVQAGGQGQRLQAVTGGGPKALAPFLEGTLLSWQLGRLRALTDEVVVLCHHGAEAVAAAAGPASVVVEPEPLDTAGGLALLPEGPEVWLVINVDHVSDIDLHSFVAAWPGGAGLAALWEVALPVDEGVVAVEQGRLVGWQERPVLRLPVTTGLYLFDAAALRRALDGRPRAMPALVQALMPEVRAWWHRGWWIDAGTPERLARAAALVCPPI